jgi:hypothetical protein
MREDNSYSIVQAITIYHYAVCNRNNDDRSCNGGPRAASSVAHQTKLLQFGHQFVDIANELNNLRSQRYRSQEESS